MHLLHRVFNLLSGFLQDELPASDSPPRFPFKFRYLLPAAPTASTLTLNPDQPSATEWAAAAGEATVKIEDYSLLFKLSGTSLLSDFIGDEKAAQVVPLSVTIRQFLLVLEVRG